MLKETVETEEKSQESLENTQKYENQTSGGLKSELPGVWKSNGSKTDINNTDSSETDLIYSAQSGENISGEMREDERYRFYFQDKLEIPILEKNFPHDREILMEIQRNITPKESCPEPSSQ